MIDGMHLAAKLEDKNLVCQVCGLVHLPSVWLQWYLGFLRRIRLWDMKEPAS